VYYGTIRVWGLTRPATRETKESKMHTSMYTYDALSGTYTVQFAGMKKTFDSFLAAKDFIDGFFDKK